MNLIAIVLLATFMSFLLSATFHGVGQKEIRLIDVLRGDFSVL